MIESELIADLKDKMTKTLNVLENDLKGLRTGRASVNLLDPVSVEAYGSRMPISQVGTITSPDAKTLTIQLWDKSMVKPVEKAITDANLGLTPNTDGQLIRLTIPSLTEQRRKDLAKLASKYAETSKISLRNIRRDGIELIKKIEKAKEIAEDTMHSLQEKIQKLTDEFVVKIDKIVELKEKEIMTV